MTPNEIAARLHELCSTSQYETAQTELFHSNATSAELDMQTGEWVTVSGIDAIKQKGKDFMAMIEAIHGGAVGTPAVYGNHIFMEIELDATMKGMDRVLMREMGHYVVADGKIISESFFF